MKNLIIILLVFITVFSCNEKSDCTDTKCITCTSINITIEEKPTGEIFAGLGAGTEGTSISAGIKENNYLCS